MRLWNQVSQWNEAVNLMEIVLLSRRKMMFALTESAVLTWWIKKAAVAEFYSRGIFSQRLTVTSDDECSCLETLRHNLFASVSLIRSHSWDSLFQSCDLRAFDGLWRSSPAPAQQCILTFEFHKQYLQIQRKSDYTVCPLCLKYVTILVKNTVHIYMFICSIKSL